MSFTELQLDNMGRAFQGWLERSLDARDGELISSLEALSSALQGPDELRVEFATLQRRVEALEQRDARA